MSSLNNAMRILSLITRERPVLRVGEVCRDLDLPKSSVSRLLRSLSEAGLLDRQARDLGYVAGPRALVLAELYLEQHTLLDLIEATLEALVAEFGFVGYAAVLSGSDIMVLRLKHGTYPLRLVQEVGKRIPAYRTAIGRALLARLPDEEALALIQAGCEEVTSREARAVLSKTRRTGLADVTSAVIPGIAAIGAAIESSTNGEALGFAISFPMTAADQVLRARMVERVQAEAQTIGGRVKDVFWSARHVQTESEPLKRERPRLRAAR